MNLRPHPPSPPELNLTPLVDVVFLLLLFFMISTTFVQERELPITLPEAEGQPVAEHESDPLVIGIDRDSHYVVAGLPLELGPDQDLQAALTLALGLALPTSHRPALLIEADAKTPHQAVIRVLDAARQLGLTQLAFATTHMTVASEPTSEPDAAVQP